jgi:DNA-binding transcriptional LysR family regulator
MDLLETMRTFVRVVEAGGLSAAARQLHRSPASVSRQLAALEQHAGASLLARNTRTSTLTEAGRAWHELATRILRELEEARYARRGVEGGLVVSAPVSLGLAHICPHLPALLERHPTLRVDLRLEDRLVDLVGEAIDLAVRAGIPPPDSPSLVARPLFTYRRKLVAAPRYIARKGSPASAEALRSHDLVVHLGAAPNGWELQHGARRLRIEAQAKFRSNAPLALLDAALHGAGIALLPDWLADEHVEAGRLRVLLPEWESEEVQVYALHRTELRGAPRVRAFVEHLVAAWTARLRAA